MVVDGDQVAPDVNYVDEWSSRIEAVNVEVLIVIKKRSELQGRGIVYNYILRLALIIPEKRVEALWLTRIDVDLTKELTILCCSFLTLVANK